MILVAIGANLPDAAGRTALDTCRWAAAELDRLPGLRVVALSRWYETAPVPPSGQPPYVNGAARLDGQAEPAALLAALHAIEAQAGRVRSVPNAARVLDLELLAMGGLVRDAPDPVLPHPRADRRAFVLLPVRDVAPDWRHPRTGATMEAMLAAVADQGARPLR